MWLSNHLTFKGPLPGPYLMSAERTAYRPQTPHPPTHSSRIPERASLVSPTPPPPVAIHLPRVLRPSQATSSWSTILYLDPGLSVNCVQPSHGLNWGEEAEHGVGRREEERNRARNKRIDEKDKETSKRRIVELQTLAMRYRLVHFLAGLSSHNMAPRWWCPLITDWEPSVHLSHCSCLGSAPQSSLIWFLIIKQKPLQNAS